MPVPVPVSLLLRDEDVGWSCGQLALDRGGQVIAANDLGRQSHIVCDYIEEISTRAGEPSLTPRRVTLYFVERSAAERAQMLKVFRERLGPSVLLDPIPIPYFYYDGVLLEADLFSAAGDETVAVHRQGTATATVNTARELSWATIDFGLEPLSVGFALLELLKEEHGLTPQRLLADRWTASSDRLSTVSHELGASDWAIDPGSTIGTGVSQVPRTYGLLTFANECGKDDTQHRAEIDGVSLALRTRGRFGHVQGRCLRPHDDLVVETTKIMSAIEQLFLDRSWDFTHVAKVTATYVGDNSPETLHGNMNVRNSYYTAPGPASTGLPVFTLADPCSRIAISVTLTISAGEDELRQ